LAAKHPVAEKSVTLKEIENMKIENYGFLRVGDKNIRLADLPSKTWLHVCHNLRLSENSVHTADPLRPPPKIILGEPAGLKKTIMKPEKKNQQRSRVTPYGKSPVLVGEDVFNAAANDFGGKGYENFNQKKLNAWKKAVLDMTAKFSGELAVVTICHEDSSAPECPRSHQGLQSNVKTFGQEFFPRKKLIDWRQSIRSQKNGQP